MSRASARGAGFTRPLAVLLLCVVLVSVLVGYVLCTTAGSSAVVRWVIARAVHARGITIRRMEGNLARGLVFDGVAIQDLHGLPTGNRLGIERLAVSLVPRRLYDSGITGAQLWLDMPGMGRVTVARCQGSLPTGFSFVDIIATDTPWFPPGSRLAIQRLDVGNLTWPVFDLRHLTVKMYNGRLGVPDAEPIVASGECASPQLALTLYARAIDLPELRQFFPTLGFIRTAHGVFTDVTLKAVGSVHELHVDGAFRAEEVSRHGLIIRDAPGTLALRFAFDQAPLKLFGTIELKSGTVTAKHTTIRLEPSLLTFAGDPATLAFNMRGTSVIEGTTIRIVLRGTHDAPDLRLSSVPPIPQERLLATLATGQRWEGEKTLSGQESISPDLAKDFIDYFMFGGLGSRLGQRLGISAVSLTYQPDTNTVGVKTILGNKVAVSYEAEQPRAEEGVGKPSGTSPSDPTRKLPMTYRVGAEYKVTPETSVKLEGEREYLQPTQPTADLTKVGTPSTPAQTRDEVFLEIERKF